jgi:hypothetical protein
MRYAPIGSRNDCRKIIDICTSARRYEILSIIREGAAGRPKFCLVEANFIVHPNLLRVPDGVVITLADHGRRGTGPTGWTQAPQLASWNDATLLQCTRGYAEHYEWIAKRAVQRKRTLIIGTDLWYLSAWTDLLESHKKKQSELLTALPTNGSAARMPDRLVADKAGTR